jgi:uncharacterized protein YkwD
MGRLDAAAELRATADRRKRVSDVAAKQVRGESVKQMASRFAAMFPSLPEDTVEGVLSELFRADSQITRELLADRAIAALVEMTLADGSPQVITSFEPPSFCEDIRVVDGQRMAHGFHVAAPTAPPASSSIDGAVEMMDVSHLSTTSATGSEQCAPVEMQEVRWESLNDFSADDQLDEQIAMLLTLSDDALAPCIHTLVGIFDRIVDDPSNMRVRRLRYANKAFAAKVGCHEAAVQLLRIAGFGEDPGDSADDRGLVFCGDHSESSLFGQVRESVHGIAETLPSSKQPSKAVAAPAQLGGYSPGNGQSSRDARRGRTAALTEKRLQNPQQFRKDALQRGSANTGKGGVIPKRAAAESENASHRQSRHFNLSDINRMRIDDEIAGTVNYAAEYRRNRHSAPAHDISTLSARTYDPELIAREALDGTNRYRASKGLPPCRWHEGIARIAAEHAATMASGAAPFSHDGFNARVARFPPNRGAGENLALSQGVSNVSQTAVDGWIKSPGHEKNLRGEWNVCGIGTACSANGTFYTTQLFANCM